jgi:hypothetical protein
MSSLRFEPIAILLSKQASLDRLLPAELLEQTPRDPLEPPTSNPGTDPDLKGFELHYMALTSAAFRLIGAPQFDRLSRLYDRIREEFAPGGPPASPIYESYAIQHILADVPQGLAGETPYSVLARLLQADPSRAPFRLLARALADSHLDLYRVLEARATSADIERIRDEQALTVRTTGPFLRSGDRILARVLPFGAGHFIAETPYLLRSPEQHWLEYLERVARAPAASADHSPPRNAKLTPKQRARLRQQKRQTLGASSSEVAIARHLKSGPRELYWFEFIFNAYAGERNGTAYLAGVPDRPETQPHHEAYAPG